MPQFRYTGEPRTYHAFGDLVDGDLVDAEPGEDVPRKDRAAWTPDHRFVLVDGPKPRTKKTAPPAPESTE